MPSLPNTSGSRCLIDDDGSASFGYRKGYRVVDRRGRMSGKTPISERPKHVEGRSELGHYEGDTVMGRDARHCLLTLVERKTRRTRILKLPARQAVEVNKALIREVRAGRLQMKSLTLDNGTEFHGFKNCRKSWASRSTSPSRITHGREGRTRTPTG